MDPKMHDICELGWTIDFITTNKCTINITKVHITITSLYIIYTPTCFDISMPSSGSSISAPCLVTWILKLLLLKLQFQKFIGMLQYYLIVFTIKPVRRYTRTLLCKQCVFEYILINIHIYVSINIKIGWTMLFVTALRESNPYISYAYC